MTGWGSDVKAYEMETYEEDVDEEEEENFNCQDGGNKLGDYVK